MAKTNQCVAECGRTSESRGLCCSCYLKARRLIRGDSEWSWERLESLGFALKKVIRVKKPKKEKERSAFDELSPMLRQTVKRIEERKKREEEWKEKEEKEYQEKWEVTAEERNKYIDKMWKLEAERIEKEKKENENA